MKLLSPLLVLLVFAMLAACSRLPVTLDEMPVEAEKNVTHQDAKEPVGESRAESEHDEMQRRLAKRDYRNVLQLIDRQLQKGAAEVDFASEYSRALNGLLQQARRSNAQGRTALAGQDFSKALELYPSDPQVTAQIDMTEAQVEKGVTRCSEKIMEEGLIAYRAGHLGEAIDAWKKILTFSPSHQPAIKAIRTAEIQLQNLEALRTGEKDD